MIEWLIALGAGVAVLKAFSGSGEPKPSPYKSPPRPIPTAAGDKKTRQVAWHRKWDQVFDGKHWISRSVVDAAVAEYPVSRFSWEGKTSSDIRSEFVAHNERFLTAQKERLAGFFSTVETSPLTDEQIEACVCMDDNVQIVAAAGSGKTSTMVAKAGYALHEKLVESDQVLLLAFNRSAAAELGDRAQRQLADIEGAGKIRATTFSAFGLDVIAKATGRKPTLLDGLEVDNGNKLTAAIVGELSAHDPDFEIAWHMFKTVYGRGLSEMPDVSNIAGIKGRYPTKNGELVRSGEELRIANYMFQHQVDYEYERDYEHDTASSQYGQYQPDFYYPLADAYHEHFALNEDGSPPPDFGQRYLDGVSWKRALHAEKATTLLETTSHGLQRSGLGELRASLEKLGIAFEYDRTRQGKGEEPISDADLVRLVRAFQQQVKGNGLTRERLRAAVAEHGKSGDAARLSAFLAIYEPIADAWDNRLADKNQIDFEDMLLIATAHVLSGQYQSPYRLILADEFQDSSRSRVRLLQALANQAAGETHLCVVGDDWQGINRFAGADISVMTEFHKAFEHATQLKLTTTFRCPQELCDISSRFVSANPAQISKAVSSTNTLPSDGKRVMAFCYAHDAAADDHIEAQLALMQDHLINGRLEAAGDRNTSVLFLGRYRRDEPAKLSSWKRRFGGQIDVSFKTIHSSKGLEADYVILLNANEGTHGFPSQIQDDPLLQVPMPSPDPFSFAEERRLFYVALTRARRQARIYSRLSGVSRFVVELAVESGVTLRTLDGQRVLTCPRCKQGVRHLRKSKSGGFEICSRAPVCSYSDNVAAGDPRLTFLPSRSAPLPVMSEGDECPEPDCGGTMVQRTGRTPFLGCSNYRSLGCGFQAKLALDQDSIVNG